MIKAFFTQLKENSNSVNESVDMILCAILYGASPNNYTMFDFKSLSWKYRSTYVTNRVSRKMIKTFNNQNYIDIFEDKSRFAEEFSEFFGRKWVSTKNLNYEIFAKFATNKKAIIFKPLENAQGQGIIVFDDLSDLKVVYETILKTKTDAIIEDWIDQNEVLSSVYKDAINCLRIITVQKNGKVYFLSGGITWGNGMKIANASACGIVSPWILRLVF